MPTFLVGPEILTLLECVHAAFANLADKYKFYRTKIVELVFKLVKHSQNMRMQW